MAALVKPSSSRATATLPGTMSWSCTSEYRETRISLVINFEPKILTLTAISSDFEPKEDVSTMSLEVKYVLERNCA